MEEGGRRIADGDNASAEPIEPEMHGGGRAGIAGLACKLRCRGITQRTDHLVQRGQPRPGDTMGYHFRVAEDRRPTFQRIARRADDIGGEQEMLRRLDEPAGMDHAHGDFGLIFGKARKIGLGADDRKGTLVNRVAAADIIVVWHSYSCRSAFETPVVPSRVRQAAADSPAPRLSSMERASLSIAKSIRPPAIRSSGRSAASPLRMRS